MQIQEPEKAVRAFESALEFNPKDVDLITRVRQFTGMLWGCPGLECVGRGYPAGSY